ncbi:uncharacterized protein LOC135931693 isoform X2 [Gordionus sp. m RMFG-2023]
MKDNLRIYFSDRTAPFDIVDKRLILLLAQFILKTSRSSSIEIALNKIVSQFKNKSWDYQTSQLGTYHLSLVLLTFTYLPEEFERIRISVTEKNALRYDMCQNAKIVFDFLDVLLSWNSSNDANFGVLTCAQSWLISLGHQSGLNLSDHLNHLKRLITMAIEGITCHPENQSGYVAFLEAVAFYPDIYRYPKLIRFLLNSLSSILSQPVTPPSFDPAQPRLLLHPFVLSMICETVEAHLDLILADAIMAGSEDVERTACFLERIAVCANYPGCYPLEERWSPIGMRGCIAIADAVEKEGLTASRLQNPLSLSSKVDEEDLIAKRSIFASLIQPFFRSLLPMLLYKAALPLYWTTGPDLLTETDTRADFNKCEDLADRSEMQDLTDDTDESLLLDKRAAPSISVYRTVEQYRKEDIGQGAWYSIIRVLGVNPVADFLLARLAHFANESRLTESFKFKELEAVLYLSLHTPINPSSSLIGGLGAILFEGIGNQIWEEAGKRCEFLLRIRLDVLAKFCSHFWLAAGPKTASFLNAAFECVKGGINSPFISDSALKALLAVFEAFGDAIEENHIQSAYQVCQTFLHHYYNATNLNEPTQAYLVYPRVTPLLSHLTVHSLPNRYLSTQTYLTSGSLALDFAPFLTLLNSLLDPLEQAIVMKLDKRILLEDWLKGVCRMVTALDSYLKALKDTLSVISPSDATLMFFHNALDGQVKNEVFDVAREREEYTPEERKKSLFKYCLVCKMIIAFADRYTPLLCSLLNLLTGITPSPSLPNAAVTLHVITLTTAFDLASDSLLLLSLPLDLISTFVSLPFLTSEDADSISRISLSTLSALTASFTPSPLMCTEAGFWGTVRIAVLASRSSRDGRNKASNSDSSWISLCRSALLEPVLAYALSYLHDQCREKGFALTSGSDADTLSIFEGALDLIRTLMDKAPELIFTNSADNFDWKYMLQMLTIYCIETLSNNQFTAVKSALSFLDQFLRCKSIGNPPVDPSFYDYFICAHSLSFKNDSNYVYDVSIPECTGYALTERLVRLLVSLFTRTYSSLSTSRNFHSSHKIPSQAFADHIIESACKLDLNLTNNWGSQFSTWLGAVIAAPRTQSFIRESSTGTTTIIKGEVLKTALMKERVNWRRLAESLKYLMTQS